MPFEDERKAADEYKRRYSSDCYLTPLNNLFRMLTVAIEKAGSTDALRVAVVSGLLAGFWQAQPGATTVTVFAPP